MCDTALQNLRASKAHPTSKNEPWNQRRLLIPDLIGALRLLGCVANHGLIEPALAVIDRPAQRFPAILQLALNSLLKICVPFRRRAANRGYQFVFHAPKDAMTRRE